MWPIYPYLPPLMCYFPDWLNNPGPFIIAIIFAHLWFCPGWKPWNNMFLFASMASISCVFYTNWYHIPPKPEDIEYLSEADTLKLCAVVLFIPCGGLVLIQYLAELLYFGFPKRDETIYYDPPDEKDEKGKPTAKDAPTKDAQNAAKDENGSTEKLKSKAPTPAGKGDSGKEKKKQ